MRKCILLVVMFLSLIGMLVANANPVQAASDDTVSPMGGSFYSDSHQFVSDKDVFYSFPWNTPDTSSIDVRYYIAPGEHMIFSTEKYNYDKDKWEPVEVTRLDSSGEYQHFSISASDWGTFRLVASTTDSRGYIATEVVFYNGWDEKSANHEALPQ